MRYETITIPLRVRGVWKVRIVMKLLLIARMIGVIRSDDHAISIAERLTPRLLRFQFGNGGKWRQVSRG